MALPPRANTELVGHEAAEAAFLSAFKAGRLHHGWLITGPEGIGKATFAYRCARFLLAGGQGESLFVPPSHSVAKRIAADGHADIITIERTENTQGNLRDEIVVGDARRIEPLFRRTAAEGGWRIVVIDGADRMNEDAQNAVLKILEEPPPMALLLLTASAPGRLLPTIRSRVRTVALNPLPEPVLCQLLEAHLGSADKAALETLARMAEGSPGRALQLHEAEAEILYREFIALVGGRSAKPLLDFAERLGRKGGEAGFAVLTRLLPEWLAEVARLAATGQTAPERVLGERVLQAGMASVQGLERSLALHDKVKRLFGQAEGLNLDRKQVLISALLAIREAAA